MQDARYSVCGVPVDACTPASMLEHLLDLSAGFQQRHAICYVNAHVHNLACRDPALRRVLQEASVCYPDGASMVWAAKRLGIPLRQRMTAADFFADYVRSLHSHRRRVFLLGGKPGVAEAAARRLAELIEGFKAAGTYHGFFRDSETPQVVDTINRTGADVLVVGMGTPRQEQWIARYHAQLDVPVAWAVGALLDFMAGCERRCPAWMGHAGLEWLFRWTQQPMRMAGRYLWGNPLFVWRVWNATRHLHALDSADEREPTRVRSETSGLPAEPKRDRALPQDPVSVPHRDPH